MAKSKATFKLGKKYVLKSEANKPGARILTCKIDYHPWDRTKRLYWTQDGKEWSQHVSVLKRSLFKEVR